MASSVTALRRPDPASVPSPGFDDDDDGDDRALTSVRSWVLARMPADGHVSMEAPDVCLYRHGEPTTFHKVATFGVTLGVVLQGQKRMRVAGHELLLDRTRLLVITRESEHLAAVSNESASKPYLALGLCFGPEQVARALLALSEATGGPSPEETLPAFVMPSDPDIVGAIERLLGTMDDPIARKLLAPLVLDEILIRLLRSDSAAAVRAGFARSGDAVRILESMRYIRQHHADKLSVEALARRSAMSPSHFAHRFSSVARTTPMRFLREARLDRARTLLLSNGTRAGEVARTVGFESAAHFTREFKRRFGVTPSSYLRAKSR